MANPLIKQYLKDKGFVAAPTRQPDELSEKSYTISGNQIHIAIPIFPDQAELGSAFILGMDYQEWITQRNKPPTW